MGIINEILDLSKIEAGRVELFPEAFELRHIVDEVLTSATPLIVKNGNDISVDIESGIQVFTDQTRLRQILTNLVGNAAKFTDKGSITIHATTEVLDDQSWISVAVQDTGIGLTEEQTRKLFEPFVQADASTTRKYGGTGLGLAISAKFTQMLGGSLQIKSPTWKRLDIYRPIAGSFAETPCCRTGTGRARTDSRLADKPRIEMNPTN